MGKLADILVKVGPPIGNGSACEKVPPDDTGGKLADGGWEGIDALHPLLGSPGAEVLEFQQLFLGQLVEVRCHTICR